MREALFLKKNKERWERIQKSPPADPDEMASEFTKLVDDLGYARTFYPGSRVTRFINSLASRIYLGIYRNRREDRNRLLEFWKRELPLTVGKHHGSMLFALIIFLLFFAVGFFSAKNDPEFVRSVLGDDYVNMTARNIDDGNPFGVYQSGNSFLMWLGLMINNIIVSFIYFARGILFGILTLTSLIKEAIRLGAFEYMFYSHGLAAKSALTVLIHGTLELTAIILASGAGIVLGKSILFPGTISRLASLQQAARDGIKIIVGLMPVFMIAAFFEGFITRHYNMPVVFSSLILIISFGFVIWYFVLLPIRLRKNMRLSAEEADLK